MELAISNSEFLRLWPSSSGAPVLNQFPSPRQVHWVSKLFKNSSTERTSDRETIPSWNSHPRTLQTRETTLTEYSPTERLSIMEHFYSSLLLSSPSHKPFESLERRMHSGGPYISGGTLARCSRALCSVFFVSAPFGGLINMFSS